MKIEIKHRWSGNILFTLEAGSLKLALEAAVKEGAYLEGADLEGAYLEGADLEGAYLKGAYLEGAYLKGAYLEGADLKGAYLEGADLKGAYLKGADLKGAYLEGAYLEGADLKGAYLEGADLEGAYLAEGIKHADPAQAVANLDKVREIIIDNQERLDMGVWHGDEKWTERTCAEETLCGTAHCLAGWLQVCSTDERIRRMDDPWLAGVLSAPVAAKMFFRGSAETLAWLKDRKYDKTEKKAA